MQRTAPTAMFLYSLTIAWFATEGHADLQFPNRPWYDWRTEPSFADMLTTLRRKSWDEKLSKVSLATTPDDNSATMKQRYCDGHQQVIEKFFRNCEFD